MVLRARHRQRALALLATCSLALTPFGCGTAEGGFRPQSLESDASTNNGGSAGSSGGSAGSADARDAAEEPAGPCGKELQPCCGGHDGICEKSATLSCNDGACVTCGKLPAPSPVCQNLAIWGTATASVTRAPDDAAASYAAEAAIDEDVCSAWASGNYAVSPDAGVAETWWQIDLGGPHEVSLLTLFLAMTPAGRVNLRVEYGSDGRAWKTAWTGAQPMSGYAPWTEGFAPPLEARFLRITFVDSPSWISIREFAAFECPGA